MPCLRVLVIEDDDATQDLVRMVLNDAGYAVDGVSDTAAGLLHLRTVPANVILLDTVAAASEHIRGFVATYRATPGCHAPIILFTAASHPEQLAEQLATDSLLAKPFDLDDLVATVRCSLKAS